MVKQIFIDKCEHEAKLNHIVECSACKHGNILLWMHVCNLDILFVQDGLVFRIQVAYHREPQVLRESVTAEGMLIQRDNAEAQALELETQHKPFLTSTLHG